jgi:tetratricopeptide (TPR) repeat protein
MPPSHETSSAARSTSPESNAVTAMAERLRAELAATESPTSQAVLLHELGVLEELIGDEAAAARDHLGAINAEPEFREPLERLVVLIERRQSYKNLGKLLERLVRIAVGPAERTRALADFGLFKAEHERDLEGARELLEEATAEQPEDAALWLGLELVAASLGDRPLRARALAARAELTQHAAWRALLRIDLARLLAETADPQAGIEVLEHAAAEDTIARYPALCALEQLGLRERRDDVVASALEAQAELLARCLSEPSAGEALGVPEHARRPESVADAWLRAAYAHRRQGSLDRATTLLDRALALLPDEPALIHARTAAADALGDLETVTALARRQLATISDRARRRGILAAHRPRAPRPSRTQRKPWRR